MVVGSLFSGIGGIDLGLERAGMRVAWQCERDAWCRGILARHWPDVPIVYDLAHIDSAYQAGVIGRVDVLAGGFPCQPVSQAGKRLAQDDHRWLWPAFAGAIRLLRPRYVLVENVPGLLARGMGDVLGDLAALGFDAEWTVFGARDVGAPHRRDRVWIVAWRPDADRDGLERRAEPHERQTAREPAPLGNHADGLRLDVADADGFQQPQEPQSDAVEQRERSPQRRSEQLPARPRASSRTCGGDDPEGTRRREPSGAPTSDESTVADAESERREPGFGTREPLRPGPAPVEPEGRAALPAGAGDGREDPWAAEPDVGRVAHGVPARVDRLRALGNAVVPQCAEHVGRWILEHDRALREAA